MTRINPGKPLYEDYSREPQSADVERQLESLKLEPPKAREAPGDLMSQIRANRRAAKPAKGSDPLRVSTAGKALTLRVDPSSLAHLLPASLESRKNDAYEKTLTAAKSAQSFIREREYEELMDQHALQIFMVRGGKIIEETPEYHSFKRLAGPKWEKVQPFLAVLLKLVRRSKEKVVHINGSMLLELLAANKKPTYPNLLPCIVSEQQGGPNFYSSMRRRAAVKIQALVRMRLAMRLVRKMKVVLAKVRHIQNWWRSRKLRQRFLAEARGRAEELLARFHARQARFQQAWPETKSASRVEVHYSNISGSELKKLGVEKYRSRVSMQVGRVFRVAQEKVEVVYVSPCEVPDDIKRYYYKVLELAGVKLGHVRVHFVHIEGEEKFPQHFSTPAKILFSRETLRRIRAVSPPHQIVNGREAFLVPGLPDKEDVRLSDYLDLPIFAGNPASNALYSKLSFSKAVHSAHQLFQECGFPLPPFTNMVFKVSDVVPQLARLIVENSHIDRWVFKIDNEFEGRGIAYFDLGSSKRLYRLCKELKNPQSDEAYADVQRLLGSLLPAKFAFAKPSLYRDYYEYMDEFCRQGGVIEGSPTSISKDVHSPGVLFAIDPEGQVEIQSTFEKILSGPFAPCGFKYPLKCLPSLNVPPADLGARADRAAGRAAVQKRALRVLQLGPGGLPGPAVPGRVRRAVHALLGERAVLPLHGPPRGVQPVLGGHGQVRREPGQAHRGPAAPALPLDAHDPLQVLLPPHAPRVALLRRPVPRRRPLLDRRVAAGRPHGPHRHRRHPRAHLRPRAQGAQLHPQTS